MSAHMRMPLTKKSGEDKEKITRKKAASSEFSKYSEVGVMIRGGRYKADLTQKELAEQLGILPHHVSEMEHGKRAVSKKMARKLGKILNLDYRLFL